MLKRFAAIVLAVAFLSLAVAPETLACHRNRRAGYYRPVATRYYSPYRGVASQRYYSEPYYRGHSTRNAILTVAAPAALGAGIGAIARGGKGAGLGALIGGGGGALYYLLKHRNRRY
jgi:hypothetical protein